MKKFRELTPISKASYNRKIKSFHNNHEWLKPFSYLRPAPGHIQLCEKMFKEIELLVSTKINEYFTGFYICDESGRLNVNFSTKDQIHPYSIRETIVSIINSTTQTSVITCCICGSRSSEIKYTKLTSRNYCRWHFQLAKSGLRFTNDFNHLEINEDELFQTGEHARYRDAETKTKFFENPEPLQEIPTEHVQIFDPSDFSKISEKLNSMTKDNQSRFTQIIEKTAAAGESGYRKLSTFKNADAQLNKFIEEFPNFQQLGNHFKDLANLYALSDNRIKSPPLLIVGEPGIGKTEACFNIAKIFEIGFRCFDMSTAQSSSFLTGSDSFWSNSHVGKLFEELCYKNCANPIIMIDEIDKAASDNRYDPMGGLYSLLEETTSKNFSDMSCKDIKIDASHINWIATANDTKKIPEPILSRFIIFEIEKPTYNQSKTIAKNIYRKIIQTNDWGHHFDDEIDNLVIEALIKFCPRSQKSIIIRGLAAAASAGRKSLTEDDLKNTRRIAKPKPLMH